ncbi:transporter substrate-binding domain-containing protein [Tropicibacter sp. R15_0]|uniref:LysM peptidoglycan-binding domain-containing protein n=1 Tax=Tropicibacter sp. R15_0 TaxID=2821101 RepID=UPI001ADA4BA0|nr:transporter substrate-binding domain-containing protein [Tropicibacter sp. R15_0]MBO9468346.1 transporter substrate-binding domain-containing protein [Tropicibacter sp. R15_0]
MRLRGLSTLFALLLPIGAAAQSCDDETYTVKPGETVFSIAEKRFGDPEKWTLIYYANQEMLQSSVFQIIPGDVLTIPCVPGQETIKAEVTPYHVDVDKAEIKLLTGTGRPPFADLNWLGQGMTTELVHAVMEETPNPVKYSVTFEEDWSKQLFPLLDEKSFDMGFPWFKPDCDATPDEPRCANFHFSDPVVEILVLLWVRKGKEFKWEQDSDIHGKTICRAAGQFTHDLDSPDRQWLSKGLINLERRNEFKGCFEALMAGEVDAVSANVFNGAHMVDKMGLRGEIEPLSRPLSVQTMHMIISKRHWRGTTMMYRFNAGLAKLRQSDRYNEIVNKHLKHFWDKLGS